MKIAILGHSPLSLETALRFHLHGAAITWFVDHDDFTLFQSPYVSAYEFTSEVGLGILAQLGLQYSPKVFAWNDWINNYEKPLTNYLKAHQEIKTDEVISITKRFLAPGESISGRSRFLDLFRVIFRINPKDFIEEQIDSNPEIYQRLTEEFVTSLASSIEMYQDYDLILDFRSDLGKASAAVSGRALGEGRASSKVSYGLDALKSSTFMKPTPDLREICLIGSDSLAAEILLSLEDWIKESRSRLFIVTTEEEPFADFLIKAEAQSANRLNNIFADIEIEFKSEVDDFGHKLRQWQELDDFVQVKYPRPAEPIPRLNYFSGHNVSAIDELIDKKRMFVTLERPEFRNGKKHTENNYLDLKTIGVDHVLVAHAKKNLSLIQVDQDEPGYFGLTPERLNIKAAWEADLLKLEGIENEIFKLFSPVGAQ